MQRLSLFTLIIKPTSCVYGIRRLAPRDGVPGADGDGRGIRLSLLLRDDAVQDEDDLVSRSLPSSGLGETDACFECVENNALSIWI